MTAAPRIVLDLSRTLSRALHAVPTGIDRVELAYAEWLLAHHPDRLDFIAVHPLGRFALLPHRTASAFVAATAERWRTPGAEHGAARDRVRRMARQLRAAILLRSALPWRGAPGVYVNTSHHHLDRPALMAAMRSRVGRLACFIHDLIPTDFPEYARPNEPARHARRMRTAAALSDIVFANSADTARGFDRCIREAGRDLAVTVAPLGVDPIGRRPATAPDADPLFLFIGTIEPRKNHLLLLHLWRKMVTERGRDATPRLMLIGRRGWENENILDMLDRCPALHGRVEERNVLSDPDMQAMLGRARALLLPSFAEGYGLPLAEALAAGVPALCSDLPALREVGGDVPEYLDPLDAPAWLSAILDYAAPDSSRRAAQLNRLPHWTPPRWDDHMRVVMAGLDQLNPIESPFSAAQAFSAPCGRVTL